MVIRIQIRFPSIRPTSWFSSRIISNGIILFQFLKKKFKVILIKMYANELFCNPYRSYTDIFKKICDMKHQLEYHDAKRQICENMIFKKIIKDLKFKDLQGSWPRTYRWRCWEKEKNNSSTIHYFCTHKTGYKHVFIISKNDQVLSRISFEPLLPDLKCVGFQQRLFEEIKNHYEIKPIFEKTVLIGKEDRDFFTGFGLP